MSKYDWLRAIESPNHLREAISHIGMREIKGSKHNPAILQMADTINPTAGAWFDTDEKAWCGVFVGYCLKKAGWDVPAGYDALRALMYSQYGVGVSPGRYALGDIAVFRRPEGGHVGFLVGQDKETLHVLGGNQGDAVSVARISKARLVAVRRPPYRNLKPPLLRNLEASGAISENEA